MQKMAGRIFRMFLAVCIAAAVLLPAAGAAAGAASVEGGKVTYSVYPYLPDMEYYAGILEEKWEELHPGTGREPRRGGGRRETERKGIT